MEITAKEVSRLRSLTGAGMMDCKKALTATGGDFDKAIEELRKKGRKVSASRSDKETREGAVFVHTADDHRSAALIALNCETDFVVKNDAFQRLGAAIAREALSAGADAKEALMDASYDGRTVGEHITDLVGKVGERIEISRMARLDGDTVTSYVHAGGKLGILVALHGAQGEATIEAGRNVGMQIAAMNPLAVDEKGLDADLIEKERAIIEEQIRAEGKPADMVPKIAEGKLRRFYKENTLLNQPFVKDNKQTIAQYLKSVAQGLTVADFCRVAIG